MAHQPTRRTARRATSRRPTTVQRDDAHQQARVLALPPEGAAQALNVTRTAVYRLIAQARQGDPEGLPSIKIGKRRLVPVSALEAFIQRRLETSL
jgi:excisionase family DNA binding protein